MSTNGVCYEAEDANTLLDAFIQIEESAATPGYGYTNKGQITIEDDIGKIVISPEHPLVVKYATGHFDSEGHHIIDTLFTCTSEDKLSQYGLSISQNKKQITWDAKIFLEKNQTIPVVPHTIYLQYYSSKNGK